MLNCSVEMLHKIKTKATFFLVTVSTIAGFFGILTPVTVNAIPLPMTTFALYQCGSQGGKVLTSIDFGCTGNQCRTNANASYCQSYHSATMDLLFAIVRFLSDGVGLVIIASIIIGGIQYTFSRGEPQAIAAATKRIQSSIIALVVFIFAYALLNFIIPNGIFGQ